jgi:hypothetical protein
MCLARMSCNPRVVRPIGYNSDPCVPASPPELVPAEVGLSEPVLGLKCPMLVTSRFTGVLRVGLARGQGNAGTARGAVRHFVVALELVSVAPQEGSDGVPGDRRSRPEGAVIVARRDVDMGGPFDLLFTEVAFVGGLVLTLHVVFLDGTPEGRMEFRNGGAATRAVGVFPPIGSDS